ncbi:MAG: hypothetical protein ACRDYW_12215 [Acidimicrobiales bacterium]
MAGVVAVAALVASAGGAAFLVAREEDEPPPTTSTTTTAVPVDQLVAALAEGLRDGLAVPLTDVEADCIAEAVIAVVGEDALAELVDDPGRSVLPADAAQRDDIVRGIVRCVPASTAGVLLGGSTSTTAEVVLPDEG